MVKSQESYDQHIGKPATFGKVRVGKKQPEKVVVAQPNTGRAVKVMLFKACLAAFFAMLLSKVYVVIETSNHLRTEFPNHVFPSMFECFTYGVGCMVVILSLRVVLSKFVFMPLGDCLLPEDKWTPEERRQRVERFGTVLFKFSYFTVATTFGYLLMKDLPFLPRSLGGSGVIKAIFEGYPLAPMAPMIFPYFMMQFGYHCHSLVFQVLMTHRNDFLEMFLHHTATLLLMCLSWHCNYWKVGCIVLFIHDIGDVIGYATKSAVDTKFSKLTLTLYVFLLIIWGHTRLIVFPFELLYATFKYSFATPHANVDFIMMNISMMLALQCLHIYWYSMFLVMGYNVITKNKIADIQQKIEVEVDASLNEESEDITEEF